jgi:hypothetical protein
MTRTTFLMMTTLALMLISVMAASAQVDTGEEICFDDRGAQIVCPAPGDPFFGQDGNYATPTPAFQDNGDGTVTDLVTGLMWAQDPGEKVSPNQAAEIVQQSMLGDHDDWRVPTITELYLLIDFIGVTPGPSADRVPQGDTLRIQNYVRCVRGGEVTVVSGNALDPHFPTTVSGA